VPIYDFKCRACGHVFEALVRLPTQASRDEIATCPACHGQDLQQLVSGFAVNSEGTRQLHLNHARQLNRKEQLEKKHAEIETMKHHDD
jgi:putative FmdB family regulatory protein